MIRVQVSSAIPRGAN